MKYIINFVANDAVLEPIIYCRSHMIGIARDQRNLLDWFLGGFYMSH